MILVAFANLGLISFDLSYFWLRPWLYKNQIQIVNKYDTIKGVEPHPITNSLVQTANELELSFIKPQTDRNILQQHKLKQKLISLSNKMIDDNPFNLSGLRGNFQKINAYVIEYITKRNKIKPKINAKEAFSIFWQMNQSEQKRNFQFFNQNLKPLIETNYFRHYNLKGNFVDDFTLIDLPFLLFFALEFLIRWFRAIRRKEHTFAFLFLFYNWYDLLGLIPIAEFRFFRLFRLLAIYIRLKKSDLTPVGDDIISRTISRYYNILTEEVSDLVALRILTDIEEEIKNGVSENIISNTLEPRRTEIIIAITEIIRTTLENQKQNQDLRQIIEASLKKSAKDVPSLELVPDFIKVRLTKEIGMAIYDSIFTTFESQLTADSKNAIITNLVDFYLDDLFNQDHDSQLSLLSKDLSLAFIHNLKERVRQKF